MCDATHRDKRAALPAEVLWGQDDHSTHRPRRGYILKAWRYSCWAEPKDFLPREHSALSHGLPRLMVIRVNGVVAACISLCVCLSPPQRTGALHSSLLTHREDSPHYTSVSLDSMWIQIPSNTDPWEYFKGNCNPQPFTWKQVRELKIIWQRHIFGQHVPNSLTWAQLL